MPIEKQPLPFMMPIGFDEDMSEGIVHNKWLGKIVEDYFYLGGRRVELLDNDKGFDELFVKEAAGEKTISLEEKVLKVLTYCTVVIPFVMLLGKLLFRLQNNFWLQPKQGQIQTEPSEALWWRTPLQAHHLQKKRHFQILTADDQRFTRAMQGCKESYQKLASRQPATFRPLMGHVNWVPAEFGFHMPAVALIASYLSERRQVSGLYACQTLAACSDALHRVAASEKEGKYAFIVPAMSSNLAAAVGGQIDYPQHKMAVCVEKKAGELRIALLDPQAHESTVDPKNFLSQQSLWEGFGVPGAFNTYELVLRAIIQANLQQFCQTSVSILSNPRETVFGCSIFALLDGATFLQDATFFDRIVKRPDKIQATPSCSIDVIEALPPDYMVGTQSMQALDRYFTSVPALAQQKLSKKDRFLRDIIFENSVQAENGRRRNHYIMWKLYKYTHIVNDAMHRLSAEELEEKVRRHLLV